MNTKNQRLFKIVFTILLSFSIFSGLVAGNAADDSDEITDIDDLSIQDLLNVEVKTASKKAEKSSDAPGIIEVITAQEIKAFGAISLFDVLQRASSIQTITSHLFVENIVNIRGDSLTHYNNHVLLLIDGRPIRELLTGGNDSPVLTTFPIDIIQRIEIVRGPGSVLYGTNAFTGVINIITKQNFQNSGLILSAGGGSFGAITGSITSGITRKNFSAVVGARYFKEDGWNYKAITVSPNPIFPYAPVDIKYGEKKIGIYSNLTYKKLHLSAFYSNFYDDSLGNLPYADRIGSNEGNRLFVDIGYAGNISKNWSTNINFTLNLTDLSVMKNNLLFPSEDNSSWGYLGEISMTGKISEKMNIIFGGVIDIRKNILRDNSTTQEEFSQTHLSAYTQLDYRLFDSLKLIAGAQLNKPHKGDADIVPRLGMIYNFKNGISLKALYGQAFRSAWPMEQMIDIPVITGNPELKPEKVGTLDCQVAYQNGSSRFSLTYFRSHVSDIITRVPSEIPGKVTYVNKAKLNVQGLEFELKTSPVKNLFLTGSAMYQDNKENKTYSPHFMFKIGTSYHTDFGLVLGLFLSHFGEALKNQGVELNPEAKAVNLLSVNLEFKPFKKLPIEVNLYIQNLLDEEYYFTEFARGWVNTLPNSPGRAFYSSLILHL